MCWPVGEIVGGAVELLAPTTNVGGVDWEDGLVVLGCVLDACGRVCDEALATLDGTVLLLMAVEGTFVLRSFKTERAEEEEEEGADRAVVLADMVCGCTAEPAEKEEEEEWLPVASGRDSIFAPDPEDREVVEERACAE